jgi:hypothetical protein
MLSSELESIYDNAAGTIRLRLADREAVNRALTHFRGLVLSTDACPLSNRELIVEPTLLSQQIDVPREKLDRVISELRRFSFVHTWVRAYCKVVEEDDDNVIVETDRPSKYRKAVEESCAHCGGMHGIEGGLEIETFFAIHVGQKADPFRLSRFALHEINTERSDASLREPDGQVWYVSLWGLLKRPFAKRAGTPKHTEHSTHALSALSENGPTMAVPTHQVWAWRLLGLIIAWTVLVVLSFLLCRQYCDLLSTMVVTGVLCSGGVLATLIFLRMVFAASFAVRSTIGLAYVFAFALVGTAVDWHVEGGEELPFQGGVNSSRPDPYLATLAVMAFMFATSLACGHPWSKGWFKASA